ncbi:hypothetical protein Patl1_26105 [Pistacia atlantica]|uniref:Uncharacterized protein n=1 Tax=Pistacia atlantica TaxID=434234 RepID=A0ACC1B334_9ROSI|nr:hypothetical protein Patl1_26105 [Pistacia atlantica]
MAIVCLSSTLVLSSSDHRHAFNLLFSCSNFKFKPSTIFPRHNRIHVLPTRPFKVYCQSKIEERQIRRCSPLLEKGLLSSNGASASDDWQAVPDIWRYSAEKYGDRVALVDPYHDPPSSITYKQIGVKLCTFQYDHGMEKCLHVVVF